jgi:hypothetical protein
MSPHEVKFWNEDHCFLVGDGPLWDQYRAAQAHVTS